MIGIGGLGDVGIRVGGSEWRFGGSGTMGEWYQVSGLRNNCQKLFDRLRSSRWSCMLLSFYPLPS